MRIRDNNYLTVKELANILGISRIAVFKKIKKGEIKAIKIGRNYIIFKEDVTNLVGGRLSEKMGIKIKEAVNRVVSEYGDVLKKLGSG